MTKAKLITAFRNTTKYGVDVSSSRFYKSNKLHKLILRPPAQVFVLSAVNYQTVCKYSYLSFVQNKNCFYRRHNTADVRKSQLVTRLLTVYCSFDSL